jgi:hypothetical protein
MTMPNRPILLNSCARAATSAEARFRIHRPIAPTRATRVVALDDAALVAVRQAAREPWAGARFFVAPSLAVAARATDIVLTSVDDTESWLSAELAGADVAVMVATSNEGAGMASAIGNACTLRGIMTAGIVISGGNGHAADAAVAALRPHARVLLVTQDEDDVVEVLTALRA